MRGFVLALILLHLTSATFHSLKYFPVGSSGLSNLPEFVSVGQLDGVKMFDYDSYTSRAQPTQDWINKVTADDPDHWTEETEDLVRQQHIFKKNMDSLRQHFNQSGGVHMFQGISGCEWDDETGDVDGFMKYAYDGENFISFDLKNKTWWPPEHQTLIIKHLWDNDRKGNIRLHHFLSQECPRRLRKYLKYGNSSLLRTEVPPVFLLQRSPWSPISCLATGFYPNRARLFWRKDGEELHEGVDIGDILPNHDGTFQMRARLNLSSDEDWRRYQCVFQLSGLKNNLLTTLDKAAARTNSAPSAPPHTWSPIPLVMSLVGALLLLVCFIGFCMYKKKQICEKGASQIGPLACVSNKKRRKWSSSGTVMQAADSALQFPADSEALKADSQIPQI